VLPFWTLLTRIRLRSLGRRASAFRWYGDLAMVCGSVTVVRSDGGSLVVVVGEHDLSTIAEIRRALSEVSDRGSVIVDLSATTFIDSSVVGAMLEFARASGPLAVVAPLGCEPRRVLDLVRFDAIAPVVASRDDAVHAWHRRA
jgi:anti-sigma B factor antagonist